MMTALASTPAETPTKQTSTVPACHPDRHHARFGLCVPCAGKFQRKRDGLERQRGNLLSSLEVDALLAEFGGQRLYNRTNLLFEDAVAPLPKFDAQIRGAFITIDLSRPVEEQIPRQCGKCSAQLRLQGRELHCQFGCGATWYLVAA